MSFKELIEELNAEIIKVGREVKTVKQASKELGLSEDSFIKSLLFISKNKPLLVIVNGKSRVNTSELKKRFGKIRMAKPDEVKSITGFEVGAVPPVLDVEIKTIIDPEVLKHDIVIGGGGAIDKLLRISPKAILEHQKADVVRVSL